MKRYRIYLLALWPAFALLIMASCTNSEDAFKGLNPSEKKLVQKIIADMNTDKEKFKDSVGFENLNSETFTFLDYIDKANAAPTQPIDEDYAKVLRDNYNSKKGIIEIAIPDQMRHVRNPQGRTVATDASSVWVAVDEFAPYFTKLIQYENKNNTRTGMQIVFGSYPYDENRDNEMNGTVRKNLDTLSGRNTVYFVGTYDSLPGSKDYFVTRHKELKKLSLPIPVKGPPMSGFLNHGTLCPDSCVNP